MVANIHKSPKLTDDKCDYVRCLLMLPKGGARQEEVAEVLDVAYEIDQI